MKRYTGKNAWWLILVFIVSNGLPLSIFRKYVEFDIILVLTLLFYYLVLDSIFVPILVKNYVELYEDYFLFYYGFSKKKIIIKEILKMEKTRNMSASSANSLDRILIETKNDELMISLKENNDFFEQINKRKYN